MDRRRIVILILALMALWGLSRIYFRTPSAELSLSPPGQPRLGQEQGEDRPAQSLTIAPVTRRQTNAIQVTDSLRLGPSEHREADGLELGAPGLGSTSVKQTVEAIGPVETGSAHDDASFLLPADPAPQTPANETIELAPFQGLHGAPSLDPVPTPSLTAANPLSLESDFGGLQLQTPRVASSNPSLTIDVSNSESPALEGSNQWNRLDVQLPAAMDLASPDDASLPEQASDDASAELPKEQAPKRRIPVIERLPFAPRGSQADETSSRDLQHSTRAVAHLTEQEEASPESNTSTPVCLASDVNSISTGDLTTVENPTSLGPLPRASWPANEREDSDGMIPFDDRPVTFGITPPTMDSSNTSPTPVVGNLLTGTVRASDEVDSSENSMPSRDNESSDAPASNAALPKPQSATLLQALSFVRPSRDLSDQRATSTAAESARQPTIDTLPALSQSEEPIASEFQATDLRATTVPDQAATP